MSDITLTVEGVQPAEINIEGIAPTIGGGATMIQEVVAPCAEIEIEGIAAASVSGSVEIVAPCAEIEIEGIAPTFGAMIIVSDPAEIDFEGIAPDVSFGVLVSPAEIEVEGIPAASVSSSGVELVVDPAEINISGITTISVLQYETVGVTVVPAEIEIEGIAPTIEVTINVSSPAEVNIEGIIASIQNVVPIMPEPELLTLFIFKIIDTPGQDDLTIPITSFQATLYRERNAYLQVVIPGLTYIDAITDRADGSMALYMAYATINTLEIQQESQLLQVEIEDPRIDKGATNKSITLSGYETTAQANARRSAPQTITLSDAWYNYKRTSGNGVTARLARPNIYLQAGDTITDDDGTFLVDRISWYKSESSHYMEIVGNYAETPAL